MLERAWGSDRFEFTVVYGRRRVGKTRLIREYIADKPAVYFMALEADEKTNLNSFPVLFPLPSLKRARFNGLTGRL